MKTLNIKLLATMFTLAAVLATAAIPATSQRRKSDDTRNRTSNEVRNTTRKSAQRTHRVNPSSKKSTDNKWKNNSRSSKHWNTTTKGNKNWNRGDRVHSNKANKHKSDPRINTTRTDRNNWGHANKSRGHSDWNRGDRIRNKKGKAHHSQKWNGNHSKHRNWSHNNWKSNKHYKHNRYSYRHHKHYYHHHTYGDVIRRFNHTPFRFFSRHNPYYYYDGHFFKYRRGIGYIHINMPYNTVFTELPYDYEKVMIDGYVYFRIGNLYFEYHPRGYRLVYPPDSYYSYRY